MTSMAFDASKIHFDSFEGGWFRLFAEPVS